mmetsp:Transcript_15854/g.36781  ORF Transcript_15854/g.36781 Transcript_15854/m.36781 type:complete len:399 (+) Transcript_15854:52-1248(+)
MDETLRTTEQDTIALAPLEAQRAVAVLDEAVEKLTFLGSITPDVLQHRDELSKFVGDEISRIIVEQRHLEARYEELIAERGTLKGLANKARYKEVQQEIAEVSRSLRESTKHLCRNLKDNPNISGNLIKIQRERADLIEALLASVGELKEKGDFRTLVDLVAENRASTERMATVVARERAMAEAVRQLDSDLTEEKQEHALGMIAQRELIDQLKGELQGLKSAATVEVRYTRKSEYGSTGSKDRAQTAEERRLEQELQGLRDKLELEKVVHGDTANFLAKKANQLGEELEAWSQKFEEDVAAAASEFEALKDKQLASRERLDMLQERKAKEDAGLEAKAKAKEAALEAEAEEAKLVEIQTAAAVKVQKVARDYLKRKAEKEAAGGKKKKGGKKGKKKK